MNTTGRTNIYLFDQLDLITSGDLTRMLQTVSEQRRETALSFRREIDRKLSVVAYLLLKFGLEKEYGITGNPIFSFGDNGKPFLKGHPAIHFNVSHCPQAVVCAISDEVVGIDVEEIQVFDDDTAQSVFNENEFHQIRNNPIPENEFAILWTRKESLLKCRGTGIIDGALPDLLEHCEEYHFQTREERDRRYVLTVCQKSYIPVTMEKVVWRSSVTQAVTSASIVSLE